MIMIKIRELMMVKGMLKNIMNSVTTSSGIILGIIERMPILRLVKIIEMRRVSTNMTTHRESIFSSIRSRRLCAVA